MADETATKVYVLFSHDPYEEHDSPSLEAIFVDPKDAEKAQMDKFSYTFGEAAAYTKEYARGSFMIDRYYSIEEQELVAKYETPEWITSALEARAKEQAAFAARFGKKD